MLAVGCAQLGSSVEERDDVGWGVGCSSDAWRRQIEGGRNWTAAAGVRRGDGCECYRSLAVKALERRRDGWINGGVVADGDGGRLAVGWREASLALIGIWLETKG
ncbi:hypothetical protein ACLOJK_011745 [Asimina triloba]